jgi:hypothetical protein
MLGPLLGSLADPSTAFAAHSGDAANRIRDPVGSLALLIPFAAWAITFGFVWSQPSPRPA